MKSRKDIYKKILHEYDLMRLQATKDLDKKKAYIYSLCPDISKIDRDLALTGARVARAIALSPEEQDTYLKQLEERNKKLNHHKKQLLEELGLDPTYLELHHNCNQCKDTGYIGSKKCTCFKTKLVEQAYSQSNIKRILASENFDTFSFDYFNQEASSNESKSSYDNMKENYEAALHFVNTFPQGQNMLYYGQAGAGKTFLTNCVAKGILDRGFTVLYFTAFELFNLLERYKFHNTEDVTEHFEAIFECDLLIIDDLGSEMNTSFTSSELFNCINTRILDKGSTIISTNLSIGDIQNNYSDRISSRIIGHYNLYKFYGQDIRIQKKIKQR